jgi:hypothetical protein
VTAAVRARLFGTVHHDCRVAPRDLPNVSVTTALAGLAVVRAEFMAAPLGEFLPAHPGYCGERVWVLMMLEPWLQGTDAG